MRSLIFLAQKVRLVAALTAAAFAVSPALVTAQISLGGGGISIGGPSGVSLGGGGVSIGGPSGVGIGVGGGGIGIGPGSIGGFGGIGSIGGLNLGIGGPSGLSVNSAGVGYGGATIAGRSRDGRLIIRAGALAKEHANLGLNLSPTLQVLKAGPGSLIRGVRPGDIITAIDGRRVLSRADLLQALAERGPNEDILVTLNRSGVTHDVLVRLGNTLASATSSATLKPSNLIDPTVVLAPTDSAIRALLGVTLAHGLTVDGLDPTGAGAVAGLQAGDILLSLNGLAITSADSLATALAALQLGNSPGELTVLRDGNPMSVVTQPARAPDAIVGAAGTGGGTGVSNALVGDADAGTGAGLATVVGKVPNTEEHAAALASGAGAGAQLNNTPVGDGGAGSGVGAGALLGGFPGSKSNDGSAAGAGGGLGTVLNNTPVGDAGAGTGVGAGLLQTDLRNLGTAGNITALGTGGGAGAVLNNDKLGNLSGGAGTGLGALLGNVPTATRPGGGLALGTGGGGGALDQNTPVGNVGLGGGAGAGALLGGLGTPGGNSGKLTGLGTGGGVGAVLNNTPVGNVDAGTGVGLGALLGGKAFDGKRLMPAVGVGDGAGVGLNNSPLGNVNVRTGTGVGLLLGGFTSGNILNLNGTELAGGGGVLLTGANTPIGDFGVSPTPGVQLAIGDANNPAGVMAGGGGSGFGGGTNGRTNPSREGATTLGGGGHYGGGGVVVPGGSGNTGGGTSTVGGGGGNAASSGSGGISVPGGSGTGGGGGTLPTGPGGVPTGDPTQSNYTLIGGTGGNSGGAGAGGIAIPGPNSGNDGGGTGGSAGGGNTLIGGTGGNGAGDGGAGGIVLPGSGNGTGGGNPGGGATTIGGTGGNPTGSGSGGIVIPGGGTGGTPVVISGTGGIPGGGGTGTIFIPGGGGGGTTTNPPGGGTTTPPGGTGGSFGSSGGAFTSNGANFGGGYPGFYSASLGLYGELGPAFLGVMLKDDTLLISHVCEHGPAEAAGVLKHDRILAIDQQQFADHAEFLTYMTQRVPLELVQVTVMRNDEPVSLAVELGGLLSPEVVYGVDVDGILSESIDDFAAEDVRAQESLGFLAGEEMTMIHVCPTDGAFAAGLRRNDVLRSINGERFADRAALTRFVQLRKRGDPLTVIVVRNDHEITLQWNLGQQSAAADLHQTAQAKPLVVLGKELEVARIDRSSDAYTAGLRSGDVVTYFNGRKVESLADTAQALSQASTEGQVHLVAMRDGDARSILWKIRKPAP